jgi:hypothetical protein
MRCNVLKLDLMSSISICTIADTVTASVIRLVYRKVEFNVIVADNAGNISKQATLIPAVLWTTKLFASITNFKRFEPQNHMLRQKSRYVRRKLLHRRGLFLL